MTPYFSIIVPVYKAEPYLRQCVDSILGQSCRDFELFLVDDGSPDGCPAICDEYAAKDPRVRVIHQPNAGPSPARRAGLAAAGGRYICFVDADDWVVPRWLETIKGHIDQNGQPDMVLFDLFQVEGDEGIPDLFIPEGYYDKARLEAEVYPWMLSDARRLPNDPRHQPSGSRHLFPAYLWSKAYRRELIAAHFVSDDRITIFEDTAMAYECAYFSRSIYVTHEKLYAYRYLPQSNLRHYRPRFMDEMDALLDYLTAHLGALDPRFAGQINAFGARRLIGYAAKELEVRHMSVRAAARSLADAMDQTGYAGKLTLTGLDMPVKVFVLTVKLRLYRTAALLTKLRMDPAGKEDSHG